MLNAHKAVSGTKNQADPEFGQIISAAVQTTADRPVRRQELDQFVQNRLSAHKIPVVWSIGTQSLRHADGKVRWQPNGNATNRVSALAASG